MKSLLISHINISIYIYVYDFKGFFQNFSRIWILSVNTLFNNIRYADTHLLRFIHRCALKEIYIAKSDTSKMHPMKAKSFFGTVELHGSTARVQYTFWITRQPYICRLKGIIWPASWYASSLLCSGVPCSKNCNI